MKNLSTLLLSFFILFFSSGQSLKAQNKKESITLTPTGNYFELTLYVSGNDLWVDLNGNGSLENNETLVSGKKEIKHLEDNTKSITIYGSILTELTINDPYDIDQIKQINLNKAFSLQKVSLNANSLTGTLDLTSCKNLVEAKIEETLLEGIHAEGCYSLTHLYVSNSPKLKELNLIDCNRLSWLEADHCIIKNPQLRGDVSLSHIFLEDNMLTELNIPMACSNLNTVSVSENPSLKELSIRSMSNLKELYASNCGLETMDISRGVTLTHIDLSRNKLTDLTLHINPINLVDFRIHQNKFSSEAMQKLVSMLPADDQSAAEKKFFAINTLGTFPREENICTKSTVALAKHRGWDVYDYHGGEESFYAGSEDSEIDPTKESVILTTSKSKGEELTIEIKGQDTFIDLNGNKKQDSGEKLEQGQTSVQLGDRNIVTLYGENIVRLTLSFNGLTTIDLGKAPHIKQLELNNNLLETVDLTELSQLQEVDLSNNKLTDVQLPTSAPISSLNLAFNELEKVLLPNFSSLETLWLNHNRFSSLNLPMLIALRELHIEVNQIGLLAMQDLINNLNSEKETTINKHFYAIKTEENNEGNHISQAMVTKAKEKGWTVYDGLNPDYEGEEDEKLGNHSEYISFTIGEGGLPSFAFFPQGEECWIDLNEMGIVKLDASNAHSLELLWVMENNLSEIVLPTSKKLKNIDLSGNKLSGDIDLTAHVALEEVFLAENNYASVKVTGLQHLHTLSLSNNKLTELNLAGCSSLRALYVATNQIRSLDCSNLQKLETLSIFDNQIKEAEMQNLIESLNSVTSTTYAKKSFTVQLVTENGIPLAEEGNELTAKQIALAENKQWVVEGWKEEGGTVVITDNERILPSNEPVLSIYTTGTGWIIKRSKTSLPAEELLVFSLRGELLYKGVLEQPLEVTLPFTHVILQYGNYRRTLIR